MLTVPQEHFTPYLPPQLRWIRGQLELGLGGFLHWQLLCATVTKSSLAQIRQVFGPYHAELTVSEKASDYCWKDDTCVHPSTRFELGTKPVAVNSKVDWSNVWESAVVGNLLAIPEGIRVRSYFALRAIGADHARPRDMVRRTRVFWGTTGAGKSFRARQEAGDSYYVKDPRTKFWCGYRGESSVIIDEFRGDIAIGHLLRWLDSYAVLVEIKGSAVPLCASDFWITSNIAPCYWYPDLDAATTAALMRRLEITEMDTPYLVQ